MENEIKLTTEELWKNTFRSVEAAYCWLQTYEGKNYELVEESITNLRKLITHGRTYEGVKTFNSATQPKTFSKNKFKKAYNYAPITYDLEPNWQQLDENTIQVELGSHGEKALAISITNASQLDMVVKDVYEAKCIAVDCEFMGVKKSLPELKLLQIGVSKYKGYAIQVDSVGLDAIVEKLKPVLEDESLDIVGWAFRSDALAIESYFNGADLAPVLDLQAKLLPVAVETLNLGSAMNKFASKWIGNEEFQKAKFAGSQFSFTGNDCIWLMTPLPPKAIVYAVFDVLSVIALHEYTRQYTSKEEYYWPFAVTANSSQKAVDKWHVQRATGINSPSSQGSNNNVFKPKKPIGRPAYVNNRVSVVSPPTTINKTNDGYDDEDIRYQRDLQLALERSVKEARGPSTSKGESSKDRVTENTESNLHSLAQELNSSSNYEVKSEHHFSNEVPITKSDTPEIEPGSWGTEMLDDRPFIGKDFSQTTSNVTTPISDSKRPIRSSHKWNNNDTTLRHQWGTKPDENLPSRWGDASKSSTTSDVKRRGNDSSPASSPQSWRSSNKTPDYTSPKSPYRSPNLAEQKMNITPSTSSNSPRPSPNKAPARSPNLEKIEGSPQSLQTSFKPTKTKYNNELKNRVAVGNQGGAFAWAPETKDQMSSATWSSFVSSSVMDWKKGKDISMEDIMNPASTVTENQPPSEPISFNTKVHDNYTRGGNVGDSETGKMTEESNNNWEQQEERPDTMMMPMNQIPIRTKFSGPRVFNPHDVDVDDGDDDEENSEGEGYNDSDFPIIKMNMKFQDNQAPKTKAQQVESLPTFVDGIYLYGDDGNSDLSMLRLTEPAHLDEVYIPPEGTDFTVAITFHFDARKNLNSSGSNPPVSLKAIQVYVSTGESYTALIERTFMMKPPGYLKHSKFGRLITDPSIKRVCWSPSYIESEMDEKMGFVIGPCVDLAVRANYGRTDTLSFVQSLQEYLEHWPDMKQFMEAKAEFEALNTKRFSSTCWDREKLPDLVLTYSALQGLASYLLYQKTLEKIHIPDQYFMYNE